MTPFERAIRDRLAAETDDLKWSKHKRECNCQCGMADIRALVALSKELREVMAKLEALPDKGGRSDLDLIAASVTALDEHRRTRPARRAGA